ncbi:MAG TPA: XRE family transcriptional regulator [Candidatus Saccharimonadaceae bacterium]|jgi:transcriptional regulator with XRE-family HTH domain|nr:XRE family transcriptional regulator [Candidatus Saccharimonadaceae bacterium]
MRTTPSHSAATPSPLPETETLESTPGLRPRDPSPSELGRRIKLLRVSRGLTLKDLEERGGISATHVSEIERGKASPTVGALGRIARALDMRPATLVEPRVLPEISVTRAADRTERRMQWGAALIEAATEPVHSAAIGAQIMTLPIRREPALTHHHEGEEWAMALSGVAEIRIDGTSYVLREGDSVHFRAHRPHSYLNLASNPAVLLISVRPRMAL